MNERIVCPEDGNAESPYSILSKRYFNAALKAEQENQKEISEIWLEKAVAYDNCVRVDNLLLPGVYK